MRIRTKELADAAFWGHNRKKWAILLHLRIVAQDYFLHISIVHLLTDLHLKTVSTNSGSWSVSSIQFTTPTGQANPCHQICAQPHQIGSAQSPCTIKIQQMHHLGAN